MRDPFAIASFLVMN